MTRSLSTTTDTHTLPHSFALFAGLGGAVLLTFGVQLWPWLGSLGQLGQILSRIFPVGRGIFEDKVANAWCFVTCLPVPQRYKLRNLLDLPSLTRLSLFATLLGILPTCVHLFAAGLHTVRVEATIDADAKHRIQKAAVAASQSGAASVTGGSRHLDAPSQSGLTASRRSRKISAAASEAGTERMSILSGAGGAPRPLLSSQVAESRPTAVVLASPAAAILPYAMLSVSMAFYLFGFQVHEKSILVPLLPLTLLISTKGDTYGGGSGASDWEWAVLGNNLATFSMWPLLKKDGVALQYWLVLGAWNWLIGYNPFTAITSHRNSIIGWFSALATAGMLGIHAAEHLAPLIIPSSVWNLIEARYPDLFPVLNVLLCAPCFFLIYLWSMKRQLEVGFAVGSTTALQWSSAGSKRPAKNKSA